MMPLGRLGYDSIPKWRESRFAGGWFRWRSGGGFYSSQ